MYQSIVKNNWCTNYNTAANWRLFLCPLFHCTMSLWKYLVLLISWYWAYILFTMLTWRILHTFPRVLRCRSLHHLRLACHALPTVVSSRTLCYGSRRRLVYTVLWNLTLFYFRFFKYCWFCWCLLGIIGSCYVSFLFLCDKTILSYSVNLIKYDNNVKQAVEGNFFSGIIYLHY